MFSWFKKRPAPQFDFDAPLLPDADKFLGDATSEFNGKQESLHRDWRFGEEAEWNYDQSTACLSLKFADGSRIEADGQILGSYATSDGSWEWAWNNPHVSPEVSRDSKTVKVAGDRFGVAYIQLGKFPVPGPEMVSYLCAIGLKASDSTGIFEGEAGPVKVMIMLKNLRRVGKAS